MNDDLISRQEVIDVLNDGAELLRGVLDETYIVGDERKKYEWGVSLIESYISEMNGLPSAQPEPFTDEEQRIFLSAMGREEHVCKHVDAVYEDSYEDSLVRICHEITRKVKGALWT